MRTHRMMVATAALLGLVACAHGNRQKTDEQATNSNEPITLAVTNDNSQDVDVFVTSGGKERQRLGMVTSGQTQNFTVPSTAMHATNTLHVIVHPIGGGGDYSTGAVTVSPGEQVQ